jgi:hypothetical protein
MLKNILNNRFLFLFNTIYYWFINSISFQPFNLTIINFLIFPIFFYLLVYINKKSKSTL